MAMEKPGYPGMYLYQGQFAAPLNGQWQFGIPLELQAQLLERTGGQRQVLFARLAGLWMFTQADGEALIAALLLQRHDRDSISAARLLARGTSAAWGPDGIVQIPPDMRRNCGATPGSTLILMGKKNRVEIWDQDKLESEYVEILT